MIVRLDFLGYDEDVCVHTEEIIMHDTPQLPYDGVHYHMERYVPAPGVMTDRPSYLMATRKRYARPNLRFCEGWALWQVIWCGVVQLRYWEPVRCRADVKPTSKKRDFAGFFAPTHVPPEVELQMGGVYTPYMTKAVSFL